MKSRSIISAVVIMLFATASHATLLQGGDTTFNTNTNANTNTNLVGVAVGVGVNNRISNDSRAAALNYVKAGDVKNTNTVTAVNEGNTLTINEAPIPANTRVEQAGKVEVKSAPNVFLGNQYPTAPCMGSTQLGGSWLGAGAAAGTSWTDDECSIRETARSFQNLSMNADAVAILCTSKYAAIAPACKALAAPAAE